MQQLDPKSIWLFFFNFVLRWIIVILYAVFMLFLVFGQFIFGSGAMPVFSFAILILLFIIPAFLILCFVWAKLTYRFYRYELTEDGFRKESGVVYKKYVTIPYDRIQNVDIYRGIMARFLGLSDLQIQTAGYSAVVTRFGVSGAGAEGRLPGLSVEAAEQLRDEVIRRARQSKNQGL
jgi:uncharacterized protein